MKLDPFPTPFRRGAQRGIIVLILGALVTALQVQPAASADILDLVAQKKIQADVIGSNIEYVQIMLRNNTSEPQTITLPQGLFFV